MRPAPLDALELVVVVDNETDTLSSIDTAVPQRPEVAALVARIAPARRLDGHDCVTVFDHLCVACHGLSVLVKARRDDRTRAMLFDAGPYGDVWIDNADRLGLDLSAIDTVFLSHWHWDHSGALPVVVAAIAAARQRAGLDPPVVDLHPDRPDQRGVLTPAGVMLMLPEEPTLDAIADAGGRIEQRDEPHLLADGMILASGAITRTTAYETGLAGHHTVRGGGSSADPLIMDERLLAAEVRGRGVTVLSRVCSHAGIVNACLTARSYFPGAQTDLVFGGYHLAGAAMEARIAATVDDLDALIAPRLVGPAHCTGWRAKGTLAQRFAPSRYAPSAVGSRYLLDGGPET